MENFSIAILPKQTSSEKMGYVRKHINAEERDMKLIYSSKEKFLTACKHYSKTSSVAIDRLPLGQRKQAVVASGFVALLCDAIGQLLRKGLY